VQIHWACLSSHVCCIVDTGAFDILVYTDKDVEVPEKWNETGPAMISNSQGVKLRSFSTSYHKVDTMVEYKNVDNWFCKLFVCAVVGACMQLNLRCLFLPTVNIHVVVVDAVNIWDNLTAQVSWLTFSVLYYVLDCQLYIELVWWVQCFTVASKLLST